MMSFRKNGINFRKSLILVSFMVIFIFFYKRGYLILSSPGQTLERSVPTLERYPPTLKPSVPTLERSVPTLERSVPTLERSVLWRNAIRAVVDCRSGKDTRAIPNPRSLQELHHGISITKPINATSPETSEERKESFKNIFNDKLWEGQEAPETGSDAIIGSGPGSTLENSQNVRKTLNAVIEEVKLILGKPVIKMLDIPCGDLTWMSVFMSNRSDVIYSGMDIVPDIIAHHSKVYTPKYPHMTFVNQDIVAQPLTEKYDLIHTRQMTQHLSSIDTIRVLGHFKDSGSHFLMATTVPSAGASDLNVKQKGRHRLQNLEAAPQSLPPPVCITQDISVEHNAVWILNLK